MSVSTEAPEILKQLIARFELHHDTYTAPNYNETLVRRDFIDPMFQALGWDIDNTQGFAENFREVVHEDSIRISGHTRAPDYSFRIGGRRIFFLEAKKPFVKLKDDPEPAFQLRRYAWTAKLPVSILTDFEEFSVYDTRVRPAHGDKASVARVLYIHYTEYLERWEEIASLFSKTAIQQGALDKFVQSSTKKRGTAEVDDAFLAEIEEWRDTLARNVALRNKDITQRELNDAVQRTIDRIIFLRICEDRAIEPYAQLQALRNGTHVYDRLKEIYKHADERYNSGLFHFRKEKDRPGEPDTFTTRLTIDDKVLKGIFRRLYYPESPYEFAVFPADILGQVYERFLGNVIRLTPGGQAKIEQKPEVRKAGGVYYTPTYIVDYIVTHTVGKLLEGKTPQEVAGCTDTWKPAKNGRPLAILDPACGSGSFLLGAYQYLLDWHLQHYIQNPKKWSGGKEPKLYEHHKGGWKLTTAERKRILLANIYGVDIDLQAVEVTKLSLLLKVLEGESAETLQSYLGFYHRHALPDLANNIKCGNSLISSAYNLGVQLDALDQASLERINAFDWKEEFKSILSGGGFNAVIGNPPYGGVFSAEEKNYLAQEFPVFGKVQDAYVAFIIQAHRLLANRGRFGFIIPSSLLGGPGYISLRTFLLSQTIHEIVLLPFDIFRDAYIDTVIITTEKAAPAVDHAILTYEYPKKERITSINLSSLELLEVNQSRWESSSDNKFILHSGMAELIAVLEKKCGILKDVVEMKRGVLFSPELLTVKRTSTTSHKYFEGSIYRYQTKTVANFWVEYGPKMKEFPKEFRWFEGKRILLRRLVNRQQRLMASATEETFITNKNLYTILPSGPLSIAAVLAILNSKLLSRIYLCRVSQATKDDFPQITIKDVLNLPCPRIDQLGEDGKKIKSLASFSERMLHLNDRLLVTKTAHHRTVLQRQIEATDAEIDRLVYELYGLTEDEIRIVEQSIQAPGAQSIGTPDA